MQHKTITKLEDKERAATQYIEKRRWGKRNTRKNLTSPFLSDNKWWGVVVERYYWCSPLLLRRPVINGDLAAKQGRRNSVENYVLVRDGYWRYRRDHRMCTLGDSGSGVVERQLREEASDLDETTTKRKRKLRRYRNGRRYIRKVLIVRHGRCYTKTW